VIVLDAYGLVALLADESAAEAVAELIAGEGVAIPVANLAETADRLARIHGSDLGTVREGIRTLAEAANLRVRPLEEDQAWRAAALRVTHYHATKRPLSLADCLLLASTGRDERVATADPHVLDTAEAEGIDWIALPDSRGRRHEPRG
jgi:PIN domain nuclease of toxin-antitoxin system